MKKIVIAFTFLAVFMASCIFRQNEIDNCIPRPFTAQENKLIDSLINFYDSVLINRYDNQPCDAYGNGEYQIYLKYVSKDEIFEEDVLRGKARKLAINLFNKVIEDSILYLTPEIEISFINREIIYLKEFHGEDSGPRATFWFSKVDLENYCGFKIKKKLNNYRRVNVPKKSDSLIVSKELIIISI